MVKYVPKAKRIRITEGYRVIDTCTVEEESHKAR
jgi:hypothetical protein